MTGFHITEHAIYPMGPSVVLRASDQPVLQHFLQAESKIHCPNLLA
jgi:hypothetical protein